LKEDDTPPCYHLVEQYSTDVLVGALCGHACEKYTCCTTILKRSKVWQPLEIQR
jgi:hypothetical protein